jgi:hypothetical protein
MARSRSVKPALRARPPQCHWAFGPQGLCRPAREEHNRGPRARAGGRLEEAVALTAQVVSSGQEAARVGGDA